MMRMAFTGLGPITRNGRISALCLGFDHCAEHTHEIRGIRETLGMRDAPGLEGFEIDPARADALRLTRKNPTPKQPGYLSLRLVGPDTDPASLKTCVTGMPLPNPKYDTYGYTCQWDRDEFMIVSILREIDTFLEDFMFAAGGGRAAIVPVSRIRTSWDEKGLTSSLCLAITDRNEFLS